MKSSRFLTPLHLLDSFQFLLEPPDYTASMDNFPFPKGSQDWMFHTYLKTFNIWNTTAKDGMASLSARAGASKLCSPVISCKDIQRKKARRFSNHGCFSASSRIGLSYLTMKTSRFINANLASHRGAPSASSILNSFGPLEAIYDSASMEHCPAASKMWEECRGRLARAF